MITINKSIFLFVSFIVISCSKKESVQPPPIASFTWANLSDGNVQFSNTSKEADSSVWDFGDGSAKSSEKEPKHTFPKNGKYTVILSVVNKVGNSEFKTEIEVSSFLAPKADFNFTYGENGLVSFSNTSTNATNYQWDFGDSTKSIDTNPSKTYKTNSTFNVKLIANGKGGINVVSKEIKISNIKPIADFTWIETEGIVSFKLNTQNSTSVEWDFGDGSKVNTTFGDVQYKYSKNGVYSVNLLVKGVGGSVSVSKKVEVKGIPIIDLTSPTLFIGGGNILYAIDANTGNKKWEFTVADDNAFVVASPAIYKDMVFISNDFYLFALNSLTGEKIWQYTFNDRFTLNSTIPIIKNDILYVSRQGSLSAINVKNGNLIWKTSSLGANSICSPVFYKNILYFADNLKSIIGIDATNGKVVWSYSLGKRPSSGIAIENDIIYFGTWTTTRTISDQEFIAVSIPKNSKLWGYTFNLGGQGYVESSPTISSNVVYFGYEDYLFALGTADGKKKWESSPNFNNNFYSSPFIYNNTCYAGDVKTSSLYAIDITNGKVKWNLPKDNGSLSSPLYFNNCIYTGSNDGTIYSINANSGVIKWIYKTPKPIKTSPCILTKNGDVYYSGLSGEVN